jgi:hypothetical protein
MPKTQFPHGGLSNCSLFKNSFFSIHHSAPWLGAVRLLPINTCNEMATLQKVSSEQKSRRHLPDGGMFQAKINDLCTTPLGLLCGFILLGCDKL